MYNFIALKDRPSTRLLVIHGIIKVSLMYKYSAALSINKNQLLRYLYALSSFDVDEPSYNKELPFRISRTIVLNA